MVVSGVVINIQCTPTQNATDVHV